MPALATQYCPHQSDGANASQRLLRCGLLFSKQRRFDNPTLFPGRSSAPTSDLGRRTIAAYANAIRIELADLSARGNDFVLHGCNLGFGGLSDLRNNVSFDKLLP